MTENKLKARVLVSGGYQGINGVDVMVWLDNGKGSIRHWVTKTITVAEANFLNGRIIEIYEDDTWKEKVVLSIDGKQTILAIADPHINEIKMLKEEHIAITMSLESELPDHLPVYRTFKWQRHFESTLEGRLRLFVESV